MNCYGALKRSYIRREEEKMKVKAEVMVTAMREGNRSVESGTLGQDRERVNRGYSGTVTYRAEQEPKDKIKVSRVFIMRERDV